MRNLHITLFFVLSLFASTAIFANSSSDSSTEWEETLRIYINKTIGGKSFSIESLDVVSSTKTVKGKGTFFGKSGVGFEASYYSEKELAFFKATMPSKSKVKVTSREITQLAGQEFKSLLPKAISKSVYLDGFSFSLDKENKEVKNLIFDFNCFKNWELLETKELKLEQIKVRFDIKNPKDKKKKKLLTTLRGITKIGSVPVELAAELKPKKEQLEFIGTASKLKFSESLHSICGKSSLNGISIPNKVLTLSIKDVRLNVFPYQKKAKLIAASNWGNIDLFAEKKSKKKKGGISYVATISTAKGFKLSNISSKLSVLDGVDLSKHKIVISSEKKSKKESSKIPSLSKLLTVIKKGCSLVAKIDITKLRIEHLVKAKEMVVNSPLNAHLENVVLESDLGIDIKLGQNSQLSDVVFLLRPSPKKFTVGLGGMLEVEVNGDELKFKGEMELIINTQTLSFLAMMKGKWQNPMGVKGLVVSNVGIDMGASFAAPAMMPKVAMSGEIKIGRFKGEAAFAFDSRNPSKSMIAAKFNQLLLADMVNMIIDPAISRKLPKDVKDAINSVQLKNVEMEVVPNSMTVLEKQYEAGFRTEGRIEIVGVGGELDVEIDYENGLYAKGNVDPIDLKIFKLKGANGNEKPGFIVDLRKDKSPRVAMNGMVKLLGVEMETDVDLKRNGFSFMVGGKLFGIFNGKIYASGQDLNRAGDMHLKVTMENDLLGFIDREVTNFVKNEINGAVEKLSAAQKTLNKAKKKVRTLDNKINAAKKAKKWITVGALESEKAIALTALEVADKALEALKFTLGAAGQIAMFIIKNGAKLLINVRAASFEGKLSGLNGGFVNISCDLEWMGKRQKVNLNFDFGNPSKSVKILAKSLIK